MNKSFTTFWVRLSGKSKFRGGFFGGGSKPKAPKPVVMPEAPVYVAPPPPPTIQSPEAKVAELDILERQKRRRSRAASAVVEPGLLAPAPTERPILKSVLG